VNSKERVMTALSTQEPDRVPINYGANPGIDARLKEHFGLEPHDGKVACPPERYQSLCQQMYLQRSSELLSRKPDTSLPPLCPLRSSCRIRQMKQPQAEPEVALSAVGGGNRTGSELAVVRDAGFVLSNLDSSTNQHRTARSPVQVLCSSIRLSISARASSIEAWNPPSNSSSSLRTSSPVMNSGMLK